MSLQCPSNPEFRTSVEQKLKAKNAAKMYRYGTPKLRDMLREKCRVRIREARRLCVDKARNIKELNLDEILRKELEELENDLEIQEEIYKEIIEEFNEWFIEQLEHEELYFIEMEVNDGLICPVCQKANLKVASELANIMTFVCPCSANFQFDKTKGDLKNLLQAKIEEHEASCANPLNFFIEPNPNGMKSMNAFCSSCDFFHSF